MVAQIEYPTVVKRILCEYSDYYAAEDEPPLRTIFDDAQYSYLLMENGWWGNDYIHHTVVHIDIIDNKLWIQWDETEAGIATDLVAAGVPHTAIVLGFRHPDVRALTEFASG